ncbi:MAG: DUF3352 domain-containing protein [Bacteroidales bacterium]
MKKTLIAISIILILGGTGAYFFFKKQQIPEYNITRLISNDAAFFLDIRTPLKFLNNLTKDNDIWNEIKQLPSAGKFAHQVGVMDSLVRNDKPIQELLRNKRLIIMAEKLGKERLGFSFLLNMDNLREQNHVLQQFKQWGNRQNYEIQSKIYNKVRLFSIYQDDNHKLSYATVKGILIASTSPILIEQAIRQSSVKSPLIDNEHFRKVSEIAGKHTAANLYINFKNFPEVISIPFNNTYRTYINNLTNFGQWAILDINLKQDVLLLNGFTVLGQENTEMMDLLKDQDPVKLEMESMLPSNTSAYISLGISNKESYLKHLRELYKEKQILGNYNNWITKIEDQYSFNPENSFYNLLYQEIGLAFMKPNKDNPRDKAIVLLKTEDKEYAQSRLVNISEKVTSESEEGLAQNISIDGENQYPVYKLPLDNLFSNLFGDVFKHIDTRYFTMIGRYAVFAGSRDLIRDFIYSNILDKTLKNNQKYQKFSDYLSDQANFHFYTNMYRSPSLISDFLRTDLQEGLRKNQNHFRKFQAFSCQLMGSGDMIYNNLFIKYIPEVSEEPQTTWETHLDTAIDSRPSLVTNHDTGENEIFVQDMNNKIYLINKTGRVLWEKQLEEPVMSDIHQIDYYKNGKLQMLFNTKNKVHLIARNGKYVENYPFRLPAPASAPLSVFDYDDNKNYRIFVPSENKRVYDFSKEGNIISGWRFGKTDTEVTQKVQHFRVGTRDYIVFADKVQIYILNRRGEVRVQPEEQFAPSRKNLFTLEEENSKTQPRLVTTDVTGTVHYVYFNGEVETAEVQPFSPDHHFLYRDVNSDGRKDFIYLDDNKLEVYQSPESKIFEHAFETEISSAPIYFYFSRNDRKLGIVSKQKNRIYLLNGNGEMHNGFPLKGSTPFTIGNLDEEDNNFNLIVGDQTNFLYNYNVLR